jgi:Ni/Fe-hydrogenase 1 B-type cytochrome subunit
MPTLPSAAPVSTHDYSAPMRVWHWGNALLVGGQLLTILFLKVIVNARAAVSELQHAGKAGSPTPLTVEQGRAVSHAISERIWDWHIAMGLALAAFWAFWVMMQVTAPIKQRFVTRLTETLRQYRLAPPAEHADARHALFAKSTYAAYYLFITVMVITGLALTWADDVAWLHSIEHTVKEVHNVTMYLILAFAAVHIGGVVWAELTSNHGLVSKMIGGEAKEKEPEKVAS